MDSNRFRLLLKISIDDVQIAKGSFDLLGALVMQICFNNHVVFADTLGILHEAENAIETVKEDEKVIKKIIELANLLKTNKEVSLRLLFNSYYSKQELIH